MIFLPRFREKHILTEEVALVYRNYIVGISGYFLATVVAAIVINLASNSSSIYYWLLATFVACFVILFRYWHVKGIYTDSKTEATAQVLSLLTLGVLWGVLPLFYFDADNTVVMVTITGLSAGVAAAALTMQSPCLPVFFAFAFTCLPSLSIGFFMLDDTAYRGMGAAVLLYLAVLIHFAHNLETMIVESINLRYKNIDLIDKLKSSVTEIKQANHAKSVFLASASHDLRQPLHALGLFIETLSGTKLDLHQQNIISHINSASDSTREMLNTLLDFSKLDAGVVESKPHAFRLQPLLNKLEKELGPSADSKNIIYRTRETDSVVYADSSLIELVLRNLISNAIRYTENGGLLVACRYKKNKTLTVEVWDTGIGIPATEYNNIFREFHQLGNPERDRHKGFGLGLSIANGLSETMKLNLTVKSEFGTGSVFRFTLPIPETSVVEDVFNEENMSRYDGKQILLIDDDEFILIAMRELLLSWGCRCLIADSAEAGVSLAKGQTIDLLIVDYRLREGKTGNEAIGLLRKNVRPDLPAIIITGDTAKDRLREVQASDALLLHKPVSSKDLQESMNLLLT